MGLISKHSRWAPCDPKYYQDRYNIISLHRGPGCRKLMHKPKLFWPSLNFVWILWAPGPISTCEKGQKFRIVLSFWSKIDKESSEKILIWPDSAKLRHKVIIFISRSNFLRYSVLSNTSNEWYKHNGVQKVNQIKFVMDGISIMAFCD